MHRPRRLPLWTSCLLALFTVLSADARGAQSAEGDRTDAARAEPPPVVPVPLEGIRPLHRVGRVLLGGQPDRTALEELAFRGTAVVVDLRRVEEERGYDETALVAALELEYVWLGFGGADPLTDTIFDAVRERIRAPERDVLVHCASSNRVGAVWLAARVLDQGVPWDTALAEARTVGLRSQPLEAAARAYVLGGGHQELGRAVEEARERFADVRHVGVAELARRLALPEPPLLLDVREAEEHATSHLPGAVRARSRAEALAALGESAEDREVVTYCSVGWRSAELARELERAGYTNVRNLEGSIFAWANSGRPVYRGTERAAKVHPYDRKWGRLLRPELRAELDD